MSFYKVLLSFLILTIIIPHTQLLSQHEGDRIPYAAGRFYEAEATKLQNNLEYLFSLAEKHTEKTVLALISPHAGFVYSGEVAANGFAQIDQDKTFEHIFIIGSSHTSYIEGASVFAGGDYLTPLGRVRVDTDLAEKLINDNPYISFKASVHKTEHIIENQLPFLQYHLKNDFSIIPMVIGTDNEKILQSIAASLAPFFNEKNLFVISADFSHYPDYEDACKADTATTRAILTNDPEALDQVIRSNKKKNYGGLVTSTCGSTAIKTLLYLTEGNENLSYVPLKYMNSGDVSIGDKNRVVGYFSIMLVSKEAEKTSFQLTEEDKSKLLNIARLTLEEYINKKEIPQLDPTQFSEALLTNTGAFVTLNKNNKLRGCIGQFVPEEPLYKVVQNMTLAAAINDRRFQVVRPEELDMIEIEVSVLTPLTKIDAVDEIVLGRDGIYIIKGNASGTFLPKVATDTGWSLEEFLGHCARDKAGIGWEGWKEADIYTYRAIVFQED
jgi:AmmeMemoRadiSam system protein B/AmmeMemoRadiSam system protein A